MEGTNQWSEQIHPILWAKLEIGMDRTLEIKDCLKILDVPQKIDVWMSKFPFQ